MMDTNTSIIEATKAMCELAKAGVDTHETIGNYKRIKGGYAESTVKQIKKCTHEYAIRGVCQECKEKGV